MSFCRARRFKETSINKILFKARAVRSKKQASNSISKKYSVSFSLYNIHV
jgi:hypothetical protein